MEFHFQNARLPTRQTLLLDVEMAARRLSERLTALHLDGLAVSDSAKMYLRSQLLNLRSVLRTFAYILSSALARNQRSYAQLVLVDHGGGVGLLSLLAKELGIGTVVYNDIWEPWCEDARAIAEAARGAPADSYVKGDMDALLGFLQARRLSCDAFCSLDVIEHIYDIDGFCRQLARLPARSLSVAMATAANPANWLIRKQLSKVHRRAEFGGRKQDHWGCREDYLVTPYLQERATIIKAHAADLSEPQIWELAASTRGLVAKDIVAVVDDFRRSGRISRQPDHPTNTVNPHTGNWAERLHDLPRLRQTLSECGFSVAILPGYYANSPSNRLVKRWAGAVLNPIITLLGKRGLCVAPFYTVLATRDP
jgi:hypothetical protein